MALAVQRADDRPYIAFQSRNVRFLRVNLLLPVDRQPDGDGDPDRCGSVRYVACRRFVVFLRRRPKGNRHDPMAASVDARILES